jgi:hypothetical protein
MPRLARVPASFFLLRENDYLCTQIIATNEERKTLNDGSDYLACLQHLHDEGSGRDYRT